MGPVLALDEYVAGAIVRARIQELSRQLLVVGDEVGCHGFTEDEVAFVLEKLADGRLMLNVEPLDAQLEMEALGQGSRQLDVKARLVGPWRLSRAGWRGRCRRSTRRAHGCGARCRGNFPGDFSGKGRMKLHSAAGIDSLSSPDSAS